jgi:hypothetical protein
MFQRLAPYENSAVKFKAGGLLERPRSPLIMTYQSESRSLDITCRGDEYRRFSLLLLGVSLVLPRVSLWLRFRTKPDCLISTLGTGVRTLGSIMRFLNGTVPWHGFVVTFYASLPQSSSVEILFLRLGYRRVTHVPYPRPAESDTKSSVLCFQAYSARSAAAALDDCE